MQSESITSISRDQKRLSRWLLIYIAGMGFIPFFGVDLSAISAGLFQLLIAFFLLKSKTLKLEAENFLFKHRFLFVIFLLWVFLAINAGLQSPILETAQGFESIISWTRLLYYFSLFAFGFSIYLFFRRVPLQQELLVKLMSLAMLAIILNMFIAYQLNPDFRESTVWMHTPPGYSNIRHIGYHVCIMSIFLLFLIHKFVRLKKLVFFSAVLFCFWTFNFWTGGRGSVLAAIIGSFIFIGMLYWKRQAWKRLLLILLVTMCSGFFLAELLAVFHWNSFFSAFQDTLNASSFERASTGRTLHWLHAVALIKEHWLTGIGTGLYRFSDAPESLSHPHNFLLQFAFDWGVFGALSMLFLLACFFLTGLLRNARKSGDVNTFSLCCGAVVLALLVLAMLDGTLYHTQPTFYFMFALVFWMVPRRGTNNINLILIFQLVK